VRNVNEIQASTQPFPILCLVYCTAKCLAMLPLIPQASEYASSYGPDAVS
jgi:hypothetical protein